MSETGLSEKVLEASWATAPLMASVCDGIGPHEPTMLNWQTLSQVRTFTYDSLSRLKTALNPESGLIAYEYDAAGNLSKRTDARGIETIFSYDALNRPTTKTYANDGGVTPPVTFQYDDPAVPYGIGRLASVSAGSPGSEVSRTDLIAYDAAANGSYNIGQATVKGWETTFRGAWNRLQLQGMLTLQDPTNDVTNTQLVRRAKQLASVSAALPLAGFDWGMGVRGSGKRVDSYYDASSYTTKPVKLGGYGVLNLTAAYRFARGSGLPVRIVG